MKPAELQGRIQQMLLSARQEYFGQLLQLLDHEDAGDVTATQCEDEIFPLSNFFGWYAAYFQTDLPHDAPVFSQILINRSSNGMTNILEVHNALACQTIGSALSISQIENTYQ